MSFKTLVLVVAATLIGSPTNAYDLFCDRPLKGGTLLERKAIISSTRETFSCSDWIKTTDNKRLPGAKNWEKTICGPIAIIKEESYESCTIDDKISGGRVTQVLCQIWGTRTDNSFSVRDKSGVDHGASQSTSRDTKCEGTNILHTEETDYDLYRSDHVITVIEKTSYKAKPKVNPNF